MNKEPMRAVMTEPKETALMRSVPVNENYSSIRVNEGLGTAILGMLTVMLLIFLVRSNRRNRELLLEVTLLKRQP